MREARLFLAAAIALTGAHAAADEPAALLSYRLEELMTMPVTVASRTPEAPQAVPGTVYVLSQHDIRDRGYRHLGELLRDLPGIASHLGTSGSLYHRLGARGLIGNEKWVILQDGVRLGSPAGEPLVIAENYPLYQVERVEIMLGPASTLYGADAVSGVVQLISRHEGLDAQLRLGDHGYQQTSAYVAQAGNHAWQLGAALHRDDHADLPRSYPELFPANQALRDFGGNIVIPASARAPYNARTESEQAQAMLTVDDWRGGWLHHGYQHPTSAGDLPEIVDYGGHWRYTLDHLFLERNWQPAGQAGSLRLQYSDYRLDTDSAFINRFTGLIPGYKYAESQRWRLEGQWLWHWRQHRLVAGGDWSRVDAIPKVPDLIRPYDHERAANDQGLYYTGTNDTLPLQIFDVRYRERSLYLEDTWTLHDRLDLRFGLHHGHDSRHGNTNTPRANLLWRFAPDWRASLLYSEAFLAPSPQFAYEHFGSFTGQQDAQGRYIANVMFVPNPALQPETLKTWELNLSHQRTRSQWQLALYRNTLDNQILGAQSPQPVSDFVPGGVILTTRQNQNVGNTRSQGLDLYGRWQVVGPHELWFSYGYLDGELEQRGRRSRLPYSPRHSLSLGLNWAASDRLLLSPRLVSADRSYALPHSRSDGVDHAPGYALLHLLARYRFDHRLDLEAQIDNLTDRRWYSVGNSTSTGFLASPQEPRRINLGLRLHF